VVLAASFVAGCEVDKEAKPWTEPEQLDEAAFPADIPLLSGYFRGRAIEYWDCGTATPAVSYVYVLYRSGSRDPIPEAEQHPIIDAVPTDPNYSPFRHVVKVTVPRAYVGNSLTSVEELETAAYLVASEPTYFAWDAPGVQADATLGGSSDPPLVVWYGGRLTHVFRLEENIRVSRRTGEISVTDMYQISREGEVAPGTAIFAMVPGSDGYSPLRRELTAPVTGDYPATGTPLWQSETAINRNMGGYLAGEVTGGDVRRNLPLKRVGDYALRDADLGGFDDSDPLLFPTEILERSVWYNGTQHRCFDCGETTGQSSGMWLLYREGTGTPIPGQLPIVTQAPGDTAYSALRRVHRVWLDASAGYEVNSIKSYDSILQTGETDEALYLAWNAPVVNHEARLSGTVEPAAAWIAGRTLYYVLFEENLALGGLGTAPSMNGFQIYKQQFPGDTVGERLEFNDIAESIPGVDRYSPVRTVSQVLVATSYPDTLWKSFAAAATDQGNYTVSSTPAPALLNQPIVP
jgi:hypothetical protein